MKVTLAFYKGRGGLYDRLIRYWTKSNYSHVEIIIGDTWYSSNMHLGGVSARPLKPLSASWDYIEVNVDGRKAKKVKKFIKEQYGTRYDWLGAFLGAGLNIDIHDKDKWFCSEIVAEILILFGEKTIKSKLKEDTFNLSPGNLYDLYKILS